MKVQKHPIAKAIAAVLSAMLAVSCIIDSPLSRKLDELDAALARQKEYTAAFEEGAVPLRDSLLNSKSDSVRWEAAYGIFSIYKCTQMDSALYYLRIMKQLSRDYPHESFLSRVEEAAVNISARNYPAVRTFLAGIDTSALNAKEKDRYYETILLLYATEAHDETLTKEEGLPSSCTKTGSPRKPFPFSRTSSRPPRPGSRPTPATVSPRPIRPPDSGKKPNSGSPRAPLKTSSGLPRSTSPSMNSP